MKILNFGSCNIDIVYDVVHIVKPGETITTLGSNKYTGGKGLNQSIAIARAGAKVWHAGCIGADGTFLRDIMSNNGVELKYLKTVDVPTGHAVIQVDANGENSIFIYPGANAKITHDYVDEVLADFDSNDYILLQNEISEIEYIIRVAYKKGLKIIFNPSPVNDKIKKIDFNKVSYLILNETEAMDISGQSSRNDFIDWVRKDYPKLTVILTLGKKGSICFDSKNMIYQAAFHVNAVDTTAAGDTFTGYFLAELSKGKSIEDCMKYAAAAAAISVSKKGAAPSIPDYKTVKKHIPGLTIYKGDNLEGKINEAVEFIEKRLATVTLNDLAKFLGYTPSYTSRWIKNNMGCSYLKFLQKIRIKTAAKYLEETQMPIGEIISLVGYKNESFFRKKFFEEYGCSALEYRKKGSVKQVMKKKESGEN